MTLTENGLAHEFVCAGCPDRVERARAVIAAGKIPTHGYCDVCKARAFAEVDAKVAEALREKPSLSGRAA